MLILISALAFTIHAKYTPLLPENVSKIVCKNRNSRRVCINREVYTFKNIRDFLDFKKKNLRKLLARFTEIRCLTGCRNSYISILHKKKNLGQLKYKYKVRAVCKAYSVNTRAGKTYSGILRTIPGCIAANLNYLPSGTKLYIPTYGYGIVSDTGKWCKTGKYNLDLCMDSYEEACLWGKRTLEVYVLN